jgi:hypothetical protein
MTMKRTRFPAVDVTRTHEIAAELEQILGPGYELMHTQRIGWMLRRYETNRARVGLAEVDSAPEGSLGALLVRHQRRVRGELQQGENANGAEGSENSFFSDVFPSFALTSRSPSGWWNREGFGEGEGQRQGARC